MIVASLILVLRCPNHNDKGTGQMAGDGSERLADSLLYGVVHEFGVVFEAELF